jgi:hypothetical protein
MGAHGVGLRTSRRGDDVGLWRATFDPCTKEIVHAWASPPHKLLTPEVIPTAFVCCEKERWRRVDVSTISCRANVVLVPAVMR